MKMSYHFYDVVIRPFSELFDHFFVHIAAKIKIAFFYLLIMFTDLAQSLWVEPQQTALELLSTPTEYWVGLFILTSIDFVFGSFRAATEKEIEWDWRIFVRGAFKYLVYAAALVVSATATNMFPMIFGLFQYGVVAILAAYETHSCFRNLKLLAVLHAVFELMKRQVPGGFSFKDIIDMKDKQLMKKANKLKRSDHLKGEKGEKGDKGEKGESGT